MKTENMNVTFLDGVLRGEYPDFYYHLGINSNDQIINKLKKVKAIMLAGSGRRIVDFSGQWSKLRNDEKIYALPKEDRFVTRFCDDILFVSHGMGMPSAAICLQELMRLVYFLKNGNPEEMDKIFWCRIGTSGGIGLEGGEVIVSTEGLMVDLKPYRLLNGGIGEYFFDGTFPQETVQNILNANKKSNFNVVAGKTVSTNEFFLEQFRLDGAICLETPQTKMAWLNWIYENGIRNIEMEAAMMAGFLNHWGFSHFATVCCSLLNRLNGDQITATAKELLSYDENSMTALLNYLNVII